jgi:squalene-hopene/tetraprenyl-beta-curcumene cyclase
MIEPERLQQAYCRVRDELLSARLPAGHWVGRLSASALSTATAVSALALVARGAAKTVDRNDVLMRRGLDWLVAQQNPDGGWGDTDRSLSNISTTMLVRAAFHLAGRADAAAETLGRAEQYIALQGGVPGLKRRYGKDKTFAVPILTNCALAGLVDWREVAPLPFEMACIPYPLLRFLRLPVVSYAVPALVAIGQARYFHHPPRNPVARLVRRWAVERSLQTLQAMQPASGGYLEATPLTSFVVMSLAGTGRADHPVAVRGVEFLVASVLPDGSWPIDTNLATWVTTLAVNALSGAGEPVDRLANVDWLLNCQHRQLHPFTHAEPGGWGWTDLSGAVPDADDTPGALLALAALQRTAGAGETGKSPHPDPLPQAGEGESCCVREAGEGESCCVREAGEGDGHGVRDASEGDTCSIRAAARMGVQWLLGLQNRDGGWPTFCRGWGTLPFDRSGVDLTAHVIRALHAWRDLDDARIPAAIRRGFDFVQRQQRPDGCWVPLWFGNQYDPAEENPVYGTARVLLAYRDVGRIDDPAAQRGLTWLAAVQRSDGGWGTAGRVEGVSSVEETAVAMEALLAGRRVPSLQPAAEKGLRWLVEAVEQNRHQSATPIGFYFARLWYYEELYPPVFCVAALGRAAADLKPHHA